MVIASRSRVAQPAGQLSRASLGLLAHNLLSPPLLPFVPEQTPGHYLAHAISALAQVPLLWLLIRSPRVPAAV